MHPPDFNLVLGRSAYPDKHPQNWVLILFPSSDLEKDIPDPNTYFYIQGGPHQDPATEYESFLDVELEFYPWTIATMERICSVDAKDKEMVNYIMSSIKAAHSQVYVCEILKGLESVHLVPGGTAERWAGRVDARL
ncbi:hypothetical protein BJX64DRAFT_291442 [Aspergillus heterothallicus]